MRRIVTAFATTVTAVVLLFSYHTSTNSAASPSTIAVGAPAPSAPAPATGTPSTPPSTAAPSGASGSGPTTVTGDVAQTRWGPVQVAITVQGGKITSVDAVQVPNGNQRDAEINGTAIPILNQEAMQAQTARIDTVSGATVTSDGYLTSLQSAIDQAHL